METKFYTQRHSEINGRNVWLYLIVCPLGYIYFVEYEKKTLELEKFYFGACEEKAEKKYNSICSKMIKGTI